MKRRSQFEMGDALLLMALLSMLCEITFVQSPISILCFIAVFALITAICVKRRIMPEVCGAMLGFAGPAMLGLYLIGELFVDSPPGVYRETEMNVPIAAFCVFFLGGIGAAFGAAFGSLFALIADIAKHDLSSWKPDE